MATESFPAGQDMVRQALAYMTSALELLDRAKAPAQIGAHLDLAICELQDSIMPQISSAAANRPS